MSELSNDKKRKDPDVILTIEHIKTRYSTVLIIDDNEIDNYISQKLIRRNNFSKHIYIHSNGKNALEFLANLGRNESIPEALIPELIFLDINLPIMDGFQFLEEFEKLPIQIKSKSKIIMLTSSVNPADLERAFNNQYVIKYISKPLTSLHLTEISL